MEVVCGVDIRGSHIGIGLMCPVKGILVGDSSQLIVRSLSTPDQLISLIKDAIDELVTGHGAKLLGVGVGSPGQTKDGVLTAAANILPGHENIQIVKLLSTALNSLPVVLINDADAFLAAVVLSNDFKKEHQEIRSAAMITLGTGIGFSLFLNNQLYEGSNGLLEGGHMIVADMSKRKCGCGQYGCVEMYSSAKNTAERYKEVASGVADTLCTGSKYVFERAEAGDEVADQILNEVRHLDDVINDNMFLYSMYFCNFHYRPLTIWLSCV